MNSSDQAYNRILEDRMKRISEKINKLKSKKVSLLSFNNLIDIKIKGLEVEYNKIKEELKAKESRMELGSTGEMFLNDYDEKYTENVEKQKDLQKKVSDLQNMLKGSDAIQTRAGRREVERRITRLNNKIDRLKDKNVGIGKVQRAFLYPKYLYQHRKQRKIDRAEGKVLFNEARVNDNEKLKQSVDRDTVVGSFKGMIYDIKGVFYKKRYDRAKGLLERMNNKYNPTVVRGARVIPINRNVRNNINNAAQQPPAQAAAPAV